MAVGFFLQTLLESLAGPLAAFGFDFLLNFPQGPRARLFRVHLFPFVEVAGEPFIPTIRAVSRGQCPDAPNTIGLTPASLLSHPGRVR